MVMIQAVTIPLATPQRTPDTFLAAPHRHVGEKILYRQSAAFAFA
jgi:hypothetical protein